MDRAHTTLQSIQTPNLVIKHDHICIVKTRPSKKVGTCVFSLLEIAQIVSISNKTEKEIHARRDGRSSLVPWILFIVFTAKILDVWGLTRMLIRVPTSPKAFILQWRTQCAMQHVRLQIELWICLRVCPGWYSRFWDGYTDFDDYSDKLPKYSCIDIAVLTFETRPLFSAPPCIVSVQQ